MLYDALPLLACPHCGARLERAGAGAVACARRHSFDVARRGYLSLLPGDRRNHEGDSAAMVAAREAFLGAGHFEPLAAELGSAARQAVADGPEGCVADLGAGTGWYLARVLERLPGRAGLALDLSKHALGRAARAHPAIAAVACDAWSRLPVRDAAAALVLSVFAPRDAAEIGRVLHPGGALLVVTPARRHLAELIPRLGLLRVDERKEERLREKLAPHLRLEWRADVAWTLQLARKDVSNLAAMGPSAHHADPADLVRRVAELPEPASVTASAMLSVWRPS